MTTAQAIKASHAQMKARIVAKENARFWAREARLARLPAIVRWFFV
jgi:hypothetical protein